MNERLAAELGRARPALARADKHVRQARRYLAQAMDQAGVVEQREVCNDIDVADLAEVLTRLAEANGRLHVLVLVEREQ